MKFPPDYPYSPPSIRFLTKVWHPNVYEVSSDQQWSRLVLCLHSFTNDLCLFVAACHYLSRTVISAYRSYTRRSTIRRVASCRANDGTRRKTCAPSCCPWFHCSTSQTPTRPRTWTRPSCTEDGETRTARTMNILTSYGNAQAQKTCCFILLISFSLPFPAFRRQAQAAKAEAEKEGIIVPLTLEEYCIKAKTKPTGQEPQVSVAAQCWWRGKWEGKEPNWCVLICVKFWSSVMQSPVCWPGYTILHKRCSRWNSMCSRTCKGSRTNVLLRSYLHWQGDWTQNKWKGRILINSKLRMVLFATTVHNLHTFYSY